MNYTYYLVANEIVNESQEKPETSKSIYNNSVSIVAKKEITKQDNQENNSLYIPFCILILFTFIFLVFTKSFDSMTSITKKRSC